MTSLQHTTDMAFDKFELDTSILEALCDAKLTHATPIQAQVLPLTLTGHDVMGLAQTGTGKTAAFLISLYQYLLKNPVHPKAKGPYAVVIAPTRELALQIKKDADLIGCYTGLKNVVLIGGNADLEYQKYLLSNVAVDIVIGTPGRLIDLYKQRALRLRNVEVCVLDEADRMFDLGFIDDVRFLIRQMPPANERLNLLFSATMAQRVQELAYEYFNAPKVVQIEGAKTADKIEQVLYHTAKHEKTPLLIGLLNQEKPTRSIIFLNTKRDLERLALVLKENGYPNAALSGDLPQKKREQMLRDFQEGKLNILVATDVAARGLHIPEVSHVFNYDLPQMAEDYVHRIGRTARAGASGKAISFACEEYVYSLPEIEHYINARIPLQNFAEDLLADVIPPSEEGLKALERKREAREGNSRDGARPHYKRERHHNNDNIGNTR